LYFLINQSLKSRKKCTLILFLHILTQKLHWKSAGINKDSNSTQYVWALKVKKVTGNKILFRVILEKCVIAVFRISCDYSWSNRNRHIFVISFICVYSLMCFFHFRIKASQFVDLWGTSRNILLFCWGCNGANSNYCNKVTKTY